jgi:hypothetical protein
MEIDSLYRQGNETNDCIPQDISSMTRINREDGIITVATDGVRFKRELV